MPLVRICQTCESDTACNYIVKRRHCADIVVMLAMCIGMVCKRCNPETGLQSEPISCEVCNACTNGDCLVRTPTLCPMCCLQSIQLMTM